MAAFADAAGAFGLLIAAAADSAVGPTHDGLVVLAAAAAEDWPADRVLLTIPRCDESDPLCDGVA
ncbi:hypothetical protein J2Y68_000596 [Paenarthrobacter nitroguajacolicus]|nr:hypothetical protein [Paenarthrobacter nitroguajacolicus]